MTQEPREDGLTDQLATGPRVGPAGAVDPLDGTGPATTTEGGPVAATKTKRKMPFWLELPLLIVVALVLAVLVKTFLVAVFYIPSGSMEQTLQIGDRVLVNKLAYRIGDIKRGQVVVFNGLDSFSPEVVTVEPTNPVRRALTSFGRAIGFAPPGEEDFIKRVIGIPGDTVACCDAKGRVTVNGVPLDETYVYQDDHKTFGPVKVPPGRLWVMGDHRLISADSRYHTDDPGQGTVPADKVIGRAFVVIWPVSHWRTLPIPATFDNPALKAAAAVGQTSAGGLPLALGLAGAVPLVGGSRRLVLRLRS